MIVANTIVPLTKDRAKQLRLKFFIQSKDSPPVEVTLDEYMEAVPEAIKDANNVPKVFMDGRVTGYVGGEDEGRLI